MRVCSESNMLRRAALLFLFSVLYIITVRGKDYHFPTASECLPPSNYVGYQSKFELPSCMKRWRQGDLAHTNHLLHDSVVYDMHMKRDPTTGASFCLPNASSLAVNSKMSQSWWPHFPHVSEMYFYFFSTLIWQRDVFGISSDFANNNNHYLCINSISVIDSNNLWLVTDSNAASNHAYITQMFAAVEEYFGIRSIQSKSCLLSQDLSVSPQHNYDAEENQWPPDGWPPAWFLHASDAYLLGNLLLGIEEEKQVCGHSDTVSADKPLRVLVLNRRDSREIMNIDEVTAFLLHFNLNNNLTTVLVKTKEEFWAAEEQQQGAVNRLFVGYMDGLTLKEQVRLLRSTNVLVTTHGAAETNIAFMLPCQLVIEVFPWGYHPVEYFGSLAAKVELVHSEWQEAFKSSVFLHDQMTEEQTSLPAEIRECKEVIDTVLLRSQYHPKADYPSNFENEKANKECLSVSKCRVCLQHKDMRGVRFDLTKLNNTLTAGLLTRTKCQSQHKFYRLNDEKNHSYLQAYPFTNDLLLHEGMVLRGRTGKSVFLLEKGFKRQFGSGGAFAARGFEWDQVVTITDELLNRLPNGEALN